MFRTLGMCSERSGQCTTATALYQGKHSHAQTRPLLGQCHNQRAFHRRVINPFFIFLFRGGGGGVIFLEGLGPPWARLGPWGPSKPWWTEGICIRRFFHTKNLTFCTWDPSQWSRIEVLLQIDVLIPQNYKCWTQSLTFGFSKLCRNEGRCLRRFSGANIDIFQILRSMNVKKN